MLLTNRFFLHQVLIFIAYSQPETFSQCVRLPLMQDAAGSSPVALGSFPSLYTGVGKTLEVVLAHRLHFGRG